mgnify:CR=1 FL=1
MAFSESNSYGDLNGTSPVTVVAAPASGTRRIVVAGSIYNNDTAAVTVTLRIKKTADSSAYIIAKVILQAGESLYVQRDDTIVLTSAESLECVLAGAITTAQPQYRFAFGDAS